MLKQQGRILAVATFLLDLGLVSAAFFLAYWLRNALLPYLASPLLGHLYPLRLYLPLLPLALLIWGGLFLASERYRSHRTVRIPEEVWAIIRVCGSGAVIFTLTLYALRLDAVLLPGDYVSRLWLLLFPLLACVLLVAEKLAIRLTLRSARAWGLNYRTVLIVGTNTSAREVAASIELHRFWGFRILGFVASEHPAPPAPPGYPLLGGVEDIPRIVQERVIDDVIFCVGRRDLDRMEDLFLSLQEQGIRTRFALNLFPHTLAKVELDDLDGVPLLTFSTGPSSLAQLLAKRLIDVTVAGMLMLVGFPVALGIALLIKLTSGGAVLFSQTRCGLNGRSFTLYKFRTMVEDAHERRQELMHLNEMSGPAFKVRDDPRVTRFGRFLRKFSLDELPQLWNVLRGDMSLVGPRPPIPEEVAHYQRWQRRRLSMKPGLTCLWQISGRNEIGDFDRWMALDLEYIDTWSPLLDFKILVKTIPVVLSGRGAS